MIKKNYKWTAIFIISTAILALPLIADAARGGRAGGRAMDRGGFQNRGQLDTGISRNNVVNRDNINNARVGNFTHNGQNYKYYHNGQYYNYQNNGNYYRYYNNGGYYNYMANGLFYLYFVNGVYCNVLKNGVCANS